MFGSLEDLHLFHNLLLQHIQSQVLLLDLFLSKLKFLVLHHGNEVGLGLLWHDFLLFHGHVVRRLRSFEALASVGRLLVICDVNT